MAAWVVHRASSAPPQTQIERILGANHEKNALKKRYTFTGWGERKLGYFRYIPPQQVVAPLFFRQKRT
ncbi:MAG: hypothetical protein EBS01_15590 [Verrucomicrobia bacterium]|nr:hypothetical protein [Verrucomicrobiota bacterium]